MAFKERPTAFGRPPAGLFADVLLDPDRDQVPGADPVVSIADGDDPGFRREVDRRARARIALRRRGVDHGRVAVLDPRGLSGPAPRRRRCEVIEAQRWRAAQPILLRGAVPPPPDLARAAADLRGRLAQGGLGAWLERAGIRVLDPAAALADPERDLARAVVAPPGGDAPPSGDANDLWIKVGRLSTFDRDASLRLRVGFGREGPDDASRDAARLRAAAELGRAALPGAPALLDDPGLAAALERIAERPLWGTNGIAYWNAPDGGARMHHDAFDEPAEGGQRGVCYWQASGETLWLALSIEDLARRVRELVDWLREGEIPWVRAALAPGEADLARLVDLCSRRAVLLYELARPGQGALGALIERPECTALLADAGHALHLRAGDVLLLPNHGLDRTAMHSVFHAGGAVAYGLSFALREEAR